MEHYLDGEGLAYLWSKIKDALSSKQDELSAGENIQISGNTISATDTTYEASDFDIKDLSDSTSLRTKWNNKQNALTSASTLYINSLDCVRDVTCGHSGDTIYKLSDMYSASENDWAVIGIVEPKDGLKFLATSNNSALKYVNYNGNDISIDYSIDGGLTWQHLSENDVITLSDGEFVLLNGNNANGIGKLDGETIKYSTFVMTGSFEVSGNIMYLLNADEEITDVPEYCFYKLFNGCESMVTAPTLPSRDLSEYCYYGMFSGCSSLNYVECYAISKSATDCVSGWLDGVATTGTFVSAPYADWEGKIPSTWAQEDEYEQYKNMYLTFEVLSGGTIGWIASGGTSYAKTIDYRINSGEWNSITSTASRAFINVSGGDIVEFRGSNISYATAKDKYSAFDGGTATYNAYGNIMSLIYGDNFIGKTSFSGGSYNFCSLFKYSKVESAEFLVLPALTLTEHCYRAMFSFATLLEVAPYLPATTLARNCYWYMFEETLISKAPILYALTIPVEGYGNMFVRCSNLSYVECYATDRSATNATQTWVNGASGRGVFVKNESMESWPRGANGIPNGWEIISKKID